MTAHASASYSLAAPMPEIDSLAAFRQLLAPYAGLPLVFTYAGRTISPGYHLTEVKAADFLSLDCGANPERWTETILQLWDVAGENRTHMAAGKFLSILDKVEARVAVDAHGLLVFECGDSTGPMQIFTVGAVRAHEDHVEVALAPRPATCKPRERGLAQSPAAKSSCCGPAKSHGRACCG